MKYDVVAFLVTAQYIRGVGNWGHGRHPPRPITKGGRGQCPL